MTPARPESPRLAWWLFASGVALYLLLSAPTLDLLGIAYEAPGGAFFEKVHPGTWLIVLAYVVSLPAYGHPFRTIAAQLRAEPLLAAYLACLFVVLGWTLSRHGASGAAFMLDTLLMPAMCVFTLSMLDSRKQYKCLVLIIALLVVNTALGIGETLVQARLLPLRVAGGSEIIEDIFRPSALLGHPLTNAMVTVTLLPAVLCLRIGNLWRGALMLLLWIGALAFGGRTAFVFATLGYGSYFLYHALRSTLQGRFSYLQLTGGALVGTAGAATLAATVFATGIGERLFKSLTWDGSAAVRYRIWDVFDFLSTTDMLIGVSPERIARLGALIGLEGSEAIENFWLAMYLQLGWIGFVPFLIAMACMFAWLWRRSRGAMRVAVVLFFIVATSNNSLATKTIVLVMIVSVTAISRRLRFPNASRESQSALAFVDQLNLKNIQ
jgi:hypothetical protein